MGTKYSEIRPLRGTTSEWQQYDIVVGIDEMAFELLSDGSRKMKIGNGFSKWSDLPYAIDFQSIVEKTNIVINLHGEVLTKKNEIDQIAIDLVDQINLIKSDTEQVKADVLQTKQDVIATKNSLVTLVDQVNLTKSSVEDIKTDTILIKDDTNALKLSTDANVQKISDTKLEIEELKTDIEEIVNKSIERPSIFKIGNELDMLKVGFRKGDTVVRTDLGKTFVLSDIDPTILENWISIETVEPKIARKILVLNLNDFIKVGMDSPVIQFPYDGKIVKAIAFCDIPTSGDNIETDFNLIHVQKMAQDTYISNVNGTFEWKKIFWFNNFNFKSGEKFIELDLTDGLFSQINAFDFIRLFVYSANNTMKNLTVQLTIEV